MIAILLTLGHGDSEKNNYLLFKPIIDKTRISMDYIYTRAGLGGSVGPAPVRLYFECLATNGG